MARKYVEVKGIPELLRIAEEVRASGEPRVLTKDDISLAILVPVRQRGARGETKTDQEAFLASAGSWKGVVDTDKLIADIRESRRRSTGAAPTL